MLRFVLVACLALIGALVAQPVPIPMEMPKEKPLKEKPMEKAKAPSVPQPTDYQLADGLLGADVAKMDQLWIANLSEEQWDALREAIVRLAAQRQILDLRESRQFFASRDDLSGDLLLLKHRATLLADVPKIELVKRFPDPKVVKGLLATNYQFREGLEERMLFELDRADLIKGVIHEAEVLAHFWEQLAKAQDEKEYVTLRRLALAEVEKQMKGKIELPAYLPQFTVRPR